MAKERILRVIILKEDGALVAQCLEYDICAHAQDEETLKRRFLAVLSFEHNLSIERGGAAFVGIPEAPREYFDLWDKCTEDTTMDAGGAQVTTRRCAENLCAA